MTAKTLISVASAIVTAGLTAQAREAKPADVAVYLTGTGEVPGLMLERAKDTAKTIFAQAGVRLAWRTGKFDSRPVFGGPVIIEVRFVDDDPTRRPGAVAYARPFTTGRRAITVMNGRIAGPGPSESWHATLLGHVLAHEICHVLQRIDRHSQTGVMKAHWSPEDVLAMRRRPLELTAADGELIRRGLDTWKAGAGSLIALATH